MSRPAAVPAAPRGPRPVRSGATVPLVALALAGCAGGGPGDAGSTDPASLPVFVDGAVVKGPVSDARVCGVWIVAGVPDAKTETCTVTGAGGAYALRMPRGAGLLSVTATGGLTRDEATGAPTPLATLRSAVAFDGTGHAVTVEVTALTELMVLRAAARGRLDEAAVAEAGAEVARAFGVAGARSLTTDRPADPGARDAHLAGTTELLYGLSNAGVSGWMVERGLASLPEALAELSTRLGAATLHEELAAYRAGIRRVIAAQPASGLSAHAGAWASAVALQFGTPPPQPTRPPVVEQDGTQRFAARWPLDDLLQTPRGMVCVTNVPATVAAATVLAAVQAHAAGHGASVTAFGPVDRCLGGGQSITIDWARPGDAPWGTAVWGDRG